MYQRTKPTPWKDNAKVKRVADNNDITVREARTLERAKEITNMEEMTDKHKELLWPGIQKAIARQALRRAKWLRDLRNNDR